MGSHPGSIDSSIFRALTMHLPGSFDGVFRLSSLHWGYPFRGRVRLIILSITGLPQV